MRCLLALLSLVFYCSGSVAQDPIKVDSLSYVYQTSSSHESKMLALKGLFWEYYFTQPDIAHPYAKEMAEFSLANDYILGQWTAFNLFGIFNYSQSEFDSATFWFSKAIVLSESKEYYDQRIYSLNYAGHSYRLQNKFLKADSCFSLFLEAARNNNDRYNLGRAYKALAINSYTQSNYTIALEKFIVADSLLSDTIQYETAEILQNIGIIYKDLKKYDLAKKYFVRSLDINNALGDEYGIHAIERSLGSLATDVGDYKTAELHLQKAFDYFKGYNDNYMLGSVSEILGVVYLALDDLVSAEYYYRYSLEKLQGISNAQTSNTYRGLGNTLKAKGLLEEAMIYYDSSIFYAKKSNSPETIREALKAKADTYYSMNNYAEAFRFQQHYQRISDSLNEVNSSKALFEIEAKYENDKKEQEIELLKVQNQLAENEKRNQRNLLLALIAIVLVTAIVFYLLYRNRQKTATKLRELDGLKSNFFANISHEFRTPLTLIKGPTQEYLSNNKAPETVRKDLKMIDRNADRLLSLVDQLLDLSKLEAGSMTLAVEAGNIAPLINSVASSFSYPAEQKDISFNCSVSEESGSFWFDHDVIEKIISNLLSNAVKYTPVGGEIRFSADISNAEALIYVKNSGNTLEKGNIEKVFERFYQAENASSGVGIGLALVKELTTLHKGSIHVSTTKNWIEFKVKLPVTRNAFSSSEFKYTSLSTKQSSLPVIDVDVNSISDEMVTSDADSPILLIVEDNSDVRNLIKRLFKDDYNVIEAENGAVGIEKAIENVPDIIISDVMMPVKDGIQLSKTVKTDERTSHIPIILLTAKAGEENQLMGLETGADDYIIKPFNNELLKVRISNLIELRNSLRARYSQEVILRPKDIAISTADESFLERVQLLLDEKLEDSAFNAEAFSEAIGMSRMQLHRKLKALVGLTTTEFIRSQRLKLAAHLLQNSGTNVSEVGYAVGFSDPSYFAKCFKEAHNHTPSQFKENLLNKEA
ncbi:MAG: response regulator [Bacteroidota bacterium]